MTAVWPLSLPQGAIVGHNDQIDNSYIVRTAVDVGPPKVRARCTMNKTTYTMQVITDQTGAQTFLSFFRSTLTNGTGIFLWNDPISGQSVSMRFMGPPKITSTGTDVFTFDFSVETP